MENSICGDGDSKKDWKNEEYEFVKLMTDIWFYINQQCELNRKSMNSLESLKFYDKWDGYFD